MRHAQSTGWQVAQEVLFVAPLTAPIMSDCCSTYCTSCSTARHRCCYWMHGIATAALHFTTSTVPVGSLPTVEPSKVLYRPTKNLPYASQEKCWGCLAGADSGRYINCMSTVTFWNPDNRQHQPKTPPLLSTFLPLSAPAKMANLLVAASGSRKVQNLLSVLQYCSTCQSLSYHSYY